MLKAITREIEIDYFIVEQCPEITVMYARWANVKSEFFSAVILTKNIDKIIKKIQDPKELESFSEKRIDPFFDSHIKNSTKLWSKKRKDYTQYLIFVSESGIDNLTEHGNCYFTEDAQFYRPSAWMKPLDKNIIPIYYSGYHASGHYFQSDKPVLRAAGMLICEDSFCADNGVSFSKVKKYLDENQLDDVSYNYDGYVYGNGKQLSLIKKFSNDEDYAKWFFEDEHMSPELKFLKELAEKIKN